MLRLLVILLGGLLLPLLAAAQSADAIPEALLAESDAVVRLDETETTYTSPTNVVERHHRQITILRQSAARKGFFTCVVDRNSALIFYSDFYFPDPEGVKRKTIVCRKITVEA